MNNHTFRIYGQVCLFGVVCLVSAGAATALGVFVRKRHGCDDQVGNFDGMNWFRRIPVAEVAASAVDGWASGLRADTFLIPV